jgi:hypothetical protein
MEVLQLLNFTLNHGLNFTDGLSAVERLARLEDEMLLELSIPEDITSFCESLM